MDSRYALSRARARDSFEARFTEASETSKGTHVVYAIVRAGGRQEKVEVGSIVVLDRIAANADGNIELAPVLLVDGDKITSDAAGLEKVKVVAEVLGNERGPKIVIQKFKNKTGYKKRQGHRSDLTRIKITSIA
jgi:large subunit ribosomal protein L21